MSAIGWLERQAFFPLIWARNIGLQQVEKHDVFKDTFMANANGLSALTGTRYGKVAAL